MPFALHLLAELEGHQDRVWNVAWNPKQPLLASCSADKEVRLYHYSTTRNFTNATSISTGHKKTVRSVAWAPSGKTLATGSFDSTISIWERPEGEEGQLDPDADWECSAVLEGHENECKCVAFSNSGSLIATCSRDKTVWVWEVQPDADFECMSVLMHHDQDVKSIAWHPHEEILASASYDDTIKLYIDDPSDDWYPFATLTGHQSTVWSISFSPCGNYLASGSADKTIRIWKRSSGGDARWTNVLVLSGAHDRSIYSISWGVGKGKTPEEGGLGWLASTGGDGKIIVWEIMLSESDNIQHHELSRFEEAHGVADVNTVSWCPRAGYEDMLATGGDDGTVRVWQVQSN